MSSLASPPCITWQGETQGCLRLIDQTRLPLELAYVDCFEIETVWDAIKQLRVRGAPAIGIAAAYGICVACRELEASSPDDRMSRVHRAADYLATSRPTAVNLFWALDRMRRTAEQIPVEVSDQQFCQQLLDEARRIHAEDRETCHAIGRWGAELIPDRAGILTHCNAGGLATAEYGTALSVIFTAQDQGKSVHVFVDETRPLLQGARLTAWELMQRHVPMTLICDNAAAQVMKEGRVQVVVTGADRIAANGDSANKIGTYGVALLAQAHGIPFYIAAPKSTFDLSLESGHDIPIEQRLDEEVTRGFGRQTAPDGVSVYNPAFDVTPASLIQGIITESGVIAPVTTENVRRVVAPK